MSEEGGKKDQRRVERMNDEKTNLKKTSRESGPASTERGLWLKVKQRELISKEKHDRRQGKEGRKLTSHRNSSSRSLPSAERL